jgi:hypothetical protein
MNRILQVVLASVLIAPSISMAQANDALPFNYKVELFRGADELADVIVFALKLEQPFLAEEFEKSNYLRLSSLDQGVYLIYPRETKFRQKHAEFYGRLKGEGKTKVRLSYEIVSENLDGTRKVDVRNADLEIELPKKPTGIKRLYQQWAIEQNKHFANLLSYYPDESFFEYVLLQSQDRYGVTPPTLQTSTSSNTEIDLYHLFSGGLSVQRSLQRQALSGGSQVGDLDIHISRLNGPSLDSLDYEKLLQEKIDDGAQPQVAEIAKFIPADQYFLHVNSMQTANELMELSTEWGENLLRLFTVNARDNHLREKYEQQLCLNVDGLTKLNQAGAISDVAITGSDFFIAEGTDVSVVIKVEKPAAFQNTATTWLEAVKKSNPGMQIRSFNYKGHQVAARYLADRTVSSFVVQKDGYAIYSNSHVAIRKIVDAIAGVTPNLRDADDYRYSTTLLAPPKEKNAAYVFTSESFLKRLFSPEFKIAEKRRLQSFNNLVMLNNASLFYRLEHGRSPSSLNDLIEGNFVNPQKIIDPSGGAFAFDVANDTCTSSLYNRIKYLTPIVELRVQKVSSREQQQYDRYKKRYESFYKQFFGPMSFRITTGDKVRIESCMLPQDNSDVFRLMRDIAGEKPLSLPTHNIADSAVASILFVPGREKVSAVLNIIPGVRKALEADPTLTDLSWVGDRLSVHFCDGDTILEIDPTRFRKMDSFIPLSVPTQSMIASLVTATNLPAYIAMDVEDEAKASRLLESVTSKIFLEQSNVAGFKGDIDAYRIPDYKKHSVYVLTFQVYAFKLRLHLALVGGQLVAATKAATLRDVIDAETNPKQQQPANGHAMLRLNFRAMEKMKLNVRLYWAEKARQACHRNIMPIYNLIKLYDVPIEEVNKLSDAKYGVTFFCPDGGDYKYDADRDQVYSTVYGNRQRARQNLSINDDSSFGRFFNSLDEITTTLRFNDDAVFTTIEITRTKVEEKK